MMMWSPSMQSCATWQWMMKQIVRADARGLAVVGRAVDGDAFAEHIVVADFQARVAALVFQVLRLHADGRRTGKFHSPAPTGCGRQ